MKINIFETILTSAGCRSIRQIFETTTQSRRALNRHILVQQLRIQQRHLPVPSLHKFIGHFATVSSTQIPMLTADAKVTQRWRYAFWGGKNWTQKGWKMTKVSVDNTSCVWRCHSLSRFQNSTIYQQRCSSFHLLHGSSQWVSPRDMQPPISCRLRTPHICLGILDIPTRSPKSKKTAVVPQFKATKSLDSSIQQSQQLSEVPTSINRESPQVTQKKHPGKNKTAQNDWP